MKSNKHASPDASNALRFLLYGIALFLILIVVGFVKDLFSKAYGVFSSFFSFLPNPKRINKINDVANSLGSDGQRIKADALAIAEAFGVNYSIFNPMRWTEDENGAYDILMKYNRTTFLKLSKVYQASTDRDLTEDILSYMHWYQIPTLKNKLL